MKKIKVLIGFSDYTESGFFFAMSNIRNSMTGNTDFPTPSPSPDTLTAPLAAYGALLEKGRARSEAETEAKNQLREQITAIVQSLGTWVQENGNNDRAILLTTGFKLSGEPKPSGPLPAPQALTVVKGLVAGSLNGSVKKVAGSRGYSFEIKEAATEGGTEWQASFCTKTKFSFTGLTQGKQYLIRVCAKGTYPSSNYTEPLAVWAA
ncbi:MAG: fibronectin type III domain-containing protein [Ilyomonas sp.]